MKNKIALILTLAIVLFIAVSFLYTQERVRRVGLERQLQDTSAKLAVTESALKNAKAEEERLTKRLQLAEVELRTANEELNNLKAIKQELTTQLDEARTELQKQVYQKLDLEQRLNRVKEEAKKLQDELANLDKVRLDLEAKIRDMEEPGPLAKSGNNIELGQIVVSGSERRKPSQALEAKVLVVNKEYNFAVINLGSKDGLRVGDTLAVYNTDKFIGDVTVEKLQEAMAAVNFVSPRIKDKLIVEKDYIFKVK
ncbi:MAG: hypothetical protein NC914_03900 [Candidatus Omnitrophica bacterium]|nr:hypothetical protein [Candidatus Omnitrophota bacterium]